MDELDLLGREAGREHLAALNVLRHAKNAFTWLALLAITLHLLCWAFLAGPAAGSKSRRWDLAVEWILAMSGFVGRAAVLVVAGVFVVVLLLSASGRLGGAAGLARACVWSLAALALVVPWVRVSPDDVASVPSAFYGLDDLNQRAGESGVDAFFSFVRFGLCPILVGVFLGAAQHSFVSAYRKITAAPSAKLPIREL